MMVLGVNSNHKLHGELCQHCSCPQGKLLGNKEQFLRYLGKLIKYEGNYLYPEEPEASARVDGFMDMMEDIWPILTWY